LIRNDSPLATYMEGAFESDAFAASEPPKLNELRTFPQRKAFAFLEQKPSPPDTVSGHHFQGKLELIEELALIKQLEQPAAEKAKEAEAFTCKGCTGKYTDATSSGAKSKKNCGYCSSECREAAKKPSACKGCTGKYTDATSSGASTKKNWGFCSSKCREDQKKAPRAPRTSQVRARAPEEPVQGLRHGPMPPRAPEEPVQGLRHGLLPAARAPEEPVQGLLSAAAAIDCSEMGRHGQRTQPVVDGRTQLRRASKSAGW
jgi:hypothetical protein